MSNKAKSREQNQKSFSNLFLHIHTDTHIQISAQVHRIETRKNMCLISLVVGFPGGTVVKNPPANAGDTEGMTSIPGLGRDPGEGNSNPLWYFCLENSMNRGAGQTRVHGAPRNT